MIYSSCTQLILIVAEMHVLLYLDLSFHSYILARKTGRRSFSLSQPQMHVLFFHCIGTLILAAFLGYLSGLVAKLDACHPDYANSAWALLQILQSGEMDFEVE